jgi:hypothetical protein
MGRYMNMNHNENNHDYAIYLFTTGQLNAGQPNVEHPICMLPIINQSMQVNCDSDRAVTEPRLKSSLLLKALF